MASTDWFRDARWGVFNHYLAPAELSADDWNSRVDGFDATDYAQQVASVGAGYVLFTIGQNSGHYCAPNATYDDLVGIRPGKCSERDLICDLSDALGELGIPLLVYLPSGAPAADAVAAKRLKWKWGFEGGWPGGWKVRTGDRLEEFQQMWEAVIREWSLRWGQKVRGWWLDGCYFADEMYRHPEPPNFGSFAAALKAGNPAAIVAFNPGVLHPIVRHSPEEDYTAGEINEPDKVECTGRWIEGAQLHMLSYLGPTWGQGPPRFSDEQVVQYTRRINECEGVLSWDVPIDPEGRIPEVFLRQLAELKQN